MKEKTIYEALLNHCEKVTQYSVSKENKKDWIFGALLFTLAEDFINPEQYNELMKKYYLI